MVEIINKTDIKIEKKLFEEIANEITDKDIEVMITDNKEIKKLNAYFRNIDKETDVLSFPLENVPGAILGGIVISIEKAKKASNLYGHSVEEEIILLFIHGLLHLCGYDHEKDSGEMRKKEEELIKRFNLPASLIVRGEKK